MERTVPIDDMPYEPWPALAGIQPGEIVIGVPPGRRFRVLATDEWIVAGERDPWAEPPFDTRMCTGPYAKLQALDDKACVVIWPRDWYAPEWMEALI